MGRISATGKVPALADGEMQVWESLAILEYLAEKFPQAGLWPAQPAARAHARSIAAEMHAGFLPLRRHYPMNMWRPVRRREPTAEVADNISRIEAMWTDCRTRFGRGGPFLFGAFGAADAMYAPVVSRFHTYAVDVGPVARAYMEAVLGLAGLGANGARPPCRSLGCCRRTRSIGPPSCGCDYLPAATSPKVPRMCIDSGARTKKIRVSRRTPDPMGGRGEGSHSNRGIIFPAAGAVIMRYRVIAFFSVVLSVLAPCGLAAAQEVPRTTSRGCSC